MVEVLKESPFLLPLILKELIEEKLSFLGNSCSEVMEFFSRNPEVLEGDPTECPLGRYLHNVLGIDPIVGTCFLWCGKNVKVPLSPGVRAFLQWYEEEEKEPKFEEHYQRSSGLRMWVA